MNDKALADRIVALGVGVNEGEPLEAQYGLRSVMDETMNATAFVRDPRVAMAMMTMAADKGLTVALGPGYGATIAKSATPTYGVYLERQDIDPNRAINEACAEALK